MVDSSTSDNNSKGPYFFGGMSFIPLIGIPFGIVAIIWGLKIKKKVPVYLGLVGMLFTFVLYGLLFYFGFVAKSGPYPELKKQLTSQLLTQTRGQILIYKERNGKLPSSLEQLGNPSSSNPVITSDAWLHKIEYKINKDGTFELRSYGPDGIPNTSDDIVSSK